jgi:hypothetical protein
VKAWQEWEESQQKTPTPKAEIGEIGFAPASTLGLKETLMRRTLLAVGFAVLASMTFAPHSGIWGLDIWGDKWGSYWWEYFPLFANTRDVLWRRLLCPDCVRGVTRRCRCEFAQVVATQGEANFMRETKHVYEVRPRKNHRGVDLISDALPFGRLWYDRPEAVNAISYAKVYSRSHYAVIRVYD